MTPECSKAIQRIKETLKKRHSKETESVVWNTGVQQSHKTQKRDLKQETVKKRP